MRVASDLYDYRINSRNLLVEVSIEEYINFARDILEKNEFQRRRVRSSKTVYSLLRTDLHRGCLIPPIVLALTSDMGHVDLKTDDFAQFLEANKQHLVILDGIQRTYTILDLLEELNSKGDEEDLKRVLGYKIRAEFYIGLNRLGILYRMLTLNTGQTPMSLRQQIEILYLDYADVSINGIELVREFDDRYATQLNQYNFRDIIEGFNSYLERNEFPIDRAQILENIQSLEKLSKENAATDLFEGYLKAWHQFVSKMNNLCGTNEVSAEFLEQYSNPFGRGAQQVFKKAQAVSGFGAAIGRLKDFGLINSFDDVTIRVEDLSLDNPIAFLDDINRCMHWIMSNSKKIGNAQRSFFQYFFREILNPEGDNYLKPETATGAALRKYQSQNI
jgi:hypothetical protein